MKKLLFIAIVAVLGLTACGPSPEELVQQGKAYLENDECIEAVKCFEKAVKKGNVEAMHEIGWMYLDGKCVDKDYEEAATWFKHAADRGYPDAQGQLALMYYYGDGVPQDYEKAAKWAKKAVVYDVDDAQYVLASLYIIGKGVPQDFNKAAELLLNLEKKGGYLAKEAQGGLAIMYLKGLGVPQSDDKAVEMWCKANDLSIAEAQFEIGDWYGKGNTELNIKQDVDKAVKWFRRAAENGNATAQYYVGNAYRKGISVTKSLTKAKYWFQKAADQGHKEAKEALEALGTREAKKNAVFTVSSNKKVKFSKGNLQYQASTKTWRFAEHQWDIIGEANKNISSSYSGWIDLFGWGTSGYNGKNPWMTSTDSRDYGNGTMDIEGTNYDWGVYITKHNGGSTSWRTLTYKEWEYVIEKRSTISGIRYAKAIVNGINGVILLPDNWSSNNYKLNNTNNDRAGYNSNRINKTDWQNSFEANGAVFLPAAGSRWEKSVGKYVGSFGYYWSASADWQDFNFAHYICFDDSIFYPVNSHQRLRGYSVRLVYDVK